MDVSDKRVGRIKEMVEACSKTAILQQTIPRQELNEHLENFKDIKLRNYLFIRFPKVDEEDLRGQAYLNSVEILADH
jgi:hypothetical protein